MSDNNTFSGADMGMAVDPGTANATQKRMSDLGTPNAGTAPDGMVPLDGSGQPKQPAGEVKPFDPDNFEAPDTSDEEQQEMVDLTKEQPDDEQPEQEAQQKDVDEPAIDYKAKYQELMDSPDLSEEFMDKVFWYDSDGKGDMMPIRVRDIPNNIMMYNDYQRKTAEVAERNRKFDNLVGGFKTLTDDVKSGDVERGMRAWRYMGGGPTLEKMVLAYVQERAELEAVPESVRNKYLAQQRADDENYYLRQENARIMRMHEEQRAQEAAQQGANAPDIQFVQDHILKTLPTIYQELGISQGEAESDAFAMELDRALAQAAKGVRAEDGTWTVAPTLKRHSTPSNKVLKDIVLATKQRVDQMLSRGYRQRPPKQKAPPTTKGTGPAAKPGSTGNISQPKRLRWSDMGKR